MNRGKKIAKLDIIYLSGLDLEPFSDSPEEIECVSGSR